MEKRDLLYEGKAKKVFKTDNPDLYIVDYKDDATAFNGQKKGAITGKGVINNKMTNIVFSYLQNHGIKTHLVEELNDRETLVKKVSIIPLEVIIRNIAAGSFSQKYGVPEGSPLQDTILEYCYKSDPLNDPLLNDSHILALGLATKEELQILSSMALTINQLLKTYFLSIDVTLVDFKIEFGRCNGEIILADEISPDTCRFWDANTGEKLDKDRFRRDLGNVEEAYQEMYHRLTAK